ncbi:TNF receptor-associated factor 2-like isoform X2 [Glandiceps talaboti]
MAGYLKTLFKYQEQVEPKFLCTHCSLILRDPLQTLCGHRYCRKCLEQITSIHGNSLCKACEAEEAEDSILDIERSFGDRAILRELNGCEVQCPNEGCEWSGTYKQYTKEHESTCPSAMIKCMKSGCKVQLRRHDLAEHLQRDCMMRPVQCQYCTEEMPFQELKKHNSECQQFPLRCQHCGKDGILRIKLKEHVDLVNGDCPKKPVSCKFREVGCTEMMEKGKVNEHDKKFLGHHLLLLLQMLIPFLNMVQHMKDESDVDSIKKTVTEHNQKIESLTSGAQNLEKTMKQIQDEMKKNKNEISNATSRSTIDKLSKSLEDLRNKQTVLNTKVVTYEGIVAVLNTQIERDAHTTNELEKSKKRDRELVESLERKIKAQDRIIVLKDVTLAEMDLRIQALEMASFDGVLLWKIPNFTTKRQEAISGKTSSIYSPCFYTSRHGYKMCARIYINGDGMGKGNHVSLFFVVMKGPFDALLRWPFRQKVTLMWLDQNNREHVIDAFRPDPTSSSFKRPSQDMNVASGCPLFMPFTSLDSPRHAYIKDDTAFIKIIVDTSDLG